MKLLYFDCFSGAAGDMVLGALLDAGLPFDRLREAIGPLLPSGADLAADRVLKSGVTATKFRLMGPNTKTRSDAHRQDHHNPSHHHDHGPHDHGHEPHDHRHLSEDHSTAGEHPHRTLAEIHGLIDRSGLSSSAKRRASTLFDRLAETEAAIHQMPIERVHLHEVGALDSIVDIVGCVFGLEWFHADRIVSSPLNVGGGTVQCAHGVMPVPAPATLRLLQGVPVYSSGHEVELVTPTGALLVSGYADAFGPMPAMTVQASGYGAGDCDLTGRPNVLRLVVGEAAGDALVEPLMVLECEIDDMNPQLFGALMDRLQAAGALDVFFTPVQMKKNRPGTLITVLAPPERRESLGSIIFRETTTIGLRWHAAERERLEREVVQVQTPHGSARVKLAWRAGAVVNAAPEFDDCARLASAAGISVKDAQALVMKAYLDRKA
ncbi:MAG TPA: nickel pincer cofactor biosynthesis protein LarC [Vicinamibacterales bacterium]